MACDINNGSVAAKVCLGDCCLCKSITLNHYIQRFREALYLGGGVLFVTSRILVVDLLKKQCPVDKLSGILVFNAHRYVHT